MRRTSGAPQTYSYEGYPTGPSASSGYPYDHPSAYQQRQAPHPPPSTQAPPSSYDPYRAAPAQGRSNPPSASSHYSSYEHYGYEAPAPAPAPASRASHYPQQHHYQQDYYSEGYEAPSSSSAYQQPAPYRDQHQAPYHQPSQVHPPSRQSSSSTSSYSSSAHAASSAPGYYGSSSSGAYSSPSSYSAPPSSSSSYLMPVSARSNPQARSSHAPNAYDQPYSSAPAPSSYPRPSRPPAPSSYSAPPPSSYSSPSSSYSASSFYSTPSSYPAPSPRPSSSSSSRPAQVPFPTPRPGPGKQPIRPSGPSYPTFSPPTPTRPGVAQAAYPAPFPPPQQRPSTNKTLNLTSPSAPRPLARPLARPVISALPSRPLPPTPVRPNPTSLPVPKQLHPAGPVVKAKVVAPQILSRKAGTNLSLVNPRAAPSPFMRTLPPPKPLVALLPTPGFSSSKTGAKPTPLLIPSKVGSAALPTLVPKLATLRFSSVAYSPLSKFRQLPHPQVVVARANKSLSLNNKPAQITPKKPAEEKKVTSTPSPAVQPEGAPAAAPEAQSKSPAAVLTKTFKKSSLGNKIEAHVKLVSVKGQQFITLNGGKTLIRLPNQVEAPKSTTYRKDQNGNLIRVETPTKVITPKLKASPITSTAVLSLAKLKSPTPLKSKLLLAKLDKRLKSGSKDPNKPQYCLFFNRFGKCNNGDKCPYLHDPSKVAVCTKFLKGLCVDEHCPFSHKVDPGKMPVCYHFLNDFCRNENCPYSHVNVNPNASVCPDFLKGFCERGESCTMKHTLVCPEFSETGSCSNGDKCKLKHIKPKRKGENLEKKEPAAFRTMKKKKKVPSKEEPASKDLPQETQEGTEIQDVTGDETTGDGMPVEAENDLDKEKLTISQQPEDAAEVAPKLSIKPEF